MSLKWVDDTHALVVYTSDADGKNTSPLHFHTVDSIFVSTLARVASKAPFEKFKARLLEKSTNEASLAVAKKMAGLWIYVISHDSVVTFNQNVEN